MDRGTKRSIDHIVLPIPPKDGSLKVRDGGRMISGFEDADWELMRYKGLTPWDDLKQIMAEELMTMQLWVLEEAGCLSWARLGAMSEERWQRLLASAPRKSLRSREDLADPCKLGPGHVSNFENMRKDARKDMWIWNHFKKLPARARVRVMRRWWQAAVGTHAWRLRGARLAGA